MADDAASTRTITPRDRDLMIRTVIGEAGNQGALGQAGVAHVIANRWLDGGYGDTPSAVVLAPQQFEPWQTRAGELQAISPASSQYQAAAKVVDGVLSGDTPDPTDGALNFLNPATTAQRRGGSLPAWANGAGVQIGAHVFVNGRPSPGGDAIEAAAPSQPATKLPPAALGFAQAPPASTSPTVPAAPAQGKNMNLATASDDDVLSLVRGPAPPAQATGKAKPAWLPDWADPNAPQGAGPAAPAGGPDYQSMPAEDLLGLVRGSGAKPAQAAPGAAVAPSDEAPPLTIRPRPQPAVASPSAPGAASTALPPQGGDDTAAFGRGILDGIPIAGPYVLGGLNRVAAGVRSLQNDTHFSDELAAVNRFSDATAANHPYATLAGNVGGTAAAFGGLGATALGARALGLTGGNLMTQMLAGGATNAAIGAADAGVRSDGDSKSMGRAAVLGAGAGAAGPLVGRGVEAASNSLYGLLRGSPSVEGVPKSASNMLLKLMAADDPSTVNANLDKLGPYGTLADAGASLRGLGQSVALRPGAPRSEIAAMLEDRATGRDPRLLADTTAALGPVTNPYGTLTQMADAQKATTDPLYRQAFAFDQVPSPALDELAGRPAVASALREAGTNAANSGTPLPSVMVNDAGQTSTPAAVQAYEAQQRPAVDAAVSRLLGGDGTVDTAAKIMTRRAKVAAPLYDQFRQSDIPTTPELADLLQRPSVKTALADAQRMAKDEGKSIYTAPSAPAWERDPLGPTSTPDAPNRPEAPTPEGETVPRPVQPDVPRPQSLINFLQKAGGLRDTGGDLRSAGLNTHPGLIRTNGGMGLDAAREAAAEAGYLGADRNHAVANTTVNDLIDRLTEHPAYSHLDDDAVHAWETHDGLVSDYSRLGGKPDSVSAAPPRAPLSAYEQDATPAGVAGGAVPKVSPEGWDYVKRAIGDKIDTARRGGANNDARVYTGLKSQLTDALDKAAPVYAQARQAYAGHSDMLDALNAGKAAFGNGVTREALADQFGSLGTEGERSMFRLGAGNALRERLALKSDHANFADAVTGNQALRDKLATLAPDPRSLRDFHGTLDAANQNFTAATRPNVQAWKDAMDTLTTRAAGQSGNQQTSTLQARNDLKSMLDGIPAFRQASALDSQYDRMGDAVRNAPKLLQSGLGAVRPEDFARDFAAMSPGEQAATRIGLRAELDRQMGTKANDLTALKGEMQGEGGWNTAKLKTAFGHDPVNKLEMAINREKVFGDTLQQVLRNSETARSQAGRDMLKDAPQAPLDLSRLHFNVTDLGDWARLANGAVLSPLLRAVRNVDTTPRDEALARALFAQGGDRDAIANNVYAGLRQQQQGTARAAARSAGGGRLMGLATDAVAPPLSSLIAPRPDQSADSRKAARR